MHSLTISNHRPPRHVFLVLKNSRWIITTITHDNVFWLITHLSSKLLGISPMPVTLMIIYVYSYNDIIIVWNFLSDLKKIKIYVSHFLLFQIPCKKYFGFIIVCDFLFFFLINVSMYTI